MSVKALTNGDSYNILSDEKDGDIQLAVTFLNEDCQLTVLPFKSGDDTQVWTLTGSDGAWTLTPWGTTLCASPANDETHVQAEKRTHVFTWDIKGSQPVEIRTPSTIDGQPQWYWSIKEPAADQAIVLGKGTGFKDQKWLFQKVQKA